MPPNPQRNGRQSEEYRYWPESQYAHPPLAPAASKNVNAENLYLSATRIGSVVFGIVGIVIYALNFQHTTEMYQARMTEKLDELVRTMQSFVSASDLSFFCMSAQQDNPNWKCPAAFQYRRQSSLTIRVKPQALIHQDIRLGSLDRPPKQDRF